MNDASDDVCFCGCGVWLTAGGPSLYFVDEPCQRSFIAQQAAHAAGDVELAAQLRAQRRETPEERVARHRREIRADAERRQDRASQQEAVRVWLRANGIDPNKVVDGKPITTTGRTVRVSEYLRNAEGYVIVLPNRVPTVEVAYPQLLPWPDGLVYEYHYEDDDVDQPSLLEQQSVEYRVNAVQAAGLLGHSEVVDAVALPDDNPLSYRTTCGYCGLRGAPYGYSIHQFSEDEPTRNYQVCEHCGTHSPDPLTAATLVLSLDDGGLTLQLTQGQRSVRRVIPSGQLADYRHLAGVWSELDEELLELRRQSIADMLAAVRADRGGRGSMSVAPLGTPLDGPGWVDVGYATGGPVFGPDAVQGDTVPAFISRHHYLPDRGDR